jgi:hypothetical protein
MSPFNLSLSKMNYSQLVATMEEVVKSIQNTAVYGDLSHLPELREKHTNVLYSIAQFDSQWDEEIT